MSICTKPTPAQLLQSDHYLKIAEIDIHEPTRFFQQHSRNSLFITTFLLFNIAGMGFMGALTAVDIIRGISVWQIVFDVFLFTAFLFLLLLPVHECIHAITYKYMGAARIRFFFSIKPPSVFTCAHLLVINRIEMIWLAALPFLVITLFLATATYLIPDYRLFFGWALFIHAFCCLGDMILISYASGYRYKLLFNYDDLTEGKSYFFERKV